MTLLYKDGKNAIIVKNIQSNIKLYQLWRIQEKLDPDLYGRIWIPRSQIDILHLEEEIKELKDTSQKNK